MVAVHLILVTVDSSILSLQMEQIGNYVVIFYLLTHLAGAFDIAMNFLLRATQPAVPEVSTAVEPEADSAVKPTPRPTTTLEGLIAEEPFPSNSIENDANTNNNGDGVSSSLTEVPTSKSQAPVGKYTDVSEEDGWITIPYSMFTCTYVCLFMYPKSQNFISIS